jgi:Ca2+-binding EF-hand superfamily protein
MNRIALLVLAVAATTASTAALAQMHRHHAGSGISRLDANHDGRIARSEIPATKAGHGKYAAMFAKDFAAIDANHDGYVVRTELQSWHQRMKPQRMAKMKQRFEQRYASADLDRDGKLSKSEVAQKMPRLEQHFAWMDDNRDGFLSRTELHP